MRSEDGAVKGLLLCHDPCILRMSLSKCLASKIYLMIISKFLPLQASRMRSGTPLTPPGTIKVLK